MKQARIKQTSIFCGLLLVLALFCACSNKYVPDFNDCTWVTQQVEQLVPLYGMDFEVYSSYTYTPQEDQLNVIYSTQSKLPAIREQYQASLKNVTETGTNDLGNLNLSGSINGKNITVQNYFSEVSSIISVTVYDVPQEDLRDALRQEMPQEIFDSIIDRAGFLGAETGSGYVLYSFDEYATDMYARVPLFSKSYQSSGTEHALDTFAQNLTNLESVEDENEIIWKEDGYLNSIIQSMDGIVTVQKMPQLK